MSGFIARNTRTDDVTFSCALTIIKTHHSWTTCRKDAYEVNDVARRKLLMAEVNISNSYKERRKVFKHICMPGGIYKNTTERGNSSCQVQHEKQLYLLGRNGKVAHFVSVVSFLSYRGSKTLINQTTVNRFVIDPLGFQTSTGYLVLRRFNSDVPRSTNCSRLPCWERNRISQQHISFAELKLSRSNLIGSLWR